VAVAEIGPDIRSRIAFVLLENGAG